MVDRTSEFERWRSTALGSCDASDACDELGVAAPRTGLLRPMWPGCPPLSGLLRTVRLEPALRAPSPLPQLLALLAESASMVVLIDLGGRADCQAWGTVLSTAARHFGVDGALVNGCMRDVDEVGGLGFPVYARGVYPGAMGGRLRVAAVDEPVEIDSSGPIASGCVVVADSSGVIFVPASAAEQVATLASTRREREVRQLEAVNAGADPRTAFIAEATGKQRRSI